MCTLYFYCWWWCCCCFTVHCSSAQFSNAYSVKLYWSGPLLSWVKLQNCFHSTSFIMKQDPMPAIFLLLFLCSFVLCMCMSNLIELCHLSASANIPFIFERIQLVKFSLSRFDRKYFNAFHSLNFLSFSHFSGRCIVALPFTWSPDHF